MLRIGDWKRGTPTDTHDIELETTLQELPLDLRGDAVETNMAVGENGGLLSRSSAGSGSHSGRSEREDGARNSEIPQVKMVSSPLSSALLFPYRTQGCTMPIWG